MNSAAAPGIDAGRRRRQLPAELSAFVGRTDELAALAGLLRRGRHVTVTGPGGVGKTRLALRAAADAANRYADGTRLVELSGLADAALLPVAVAQCLGLHGRDPRPARAAVLDHLRGKRLLLIFDTCEHLTAAVARFTSQLLRETDGITILATSRQPLHLAGEQVLRLGPLPVPKAGRDPAPGGAVELFATRAAAAARVHGLRRGAARRDQDLPSGSTASRSASNSPPSACGRCRWPSWPTALTPRSRCWRARGGARCRATRRCRPRSTGPTVCARRPSGRSGSGCRCSPGPSTSPPRGTWRPARWSPPTRSATCSPASWTSPSFSGRDRLADGSGAGYRLIGSVREFGAERLAAADQEADARRRHERRYRRMARSFLRHLLADDQTARLARAADRARRPQRRA